MHSPGQIMANAQHFVSIHYLRGLAALLVCVFHSFSSVDFMRDSVSSVNWMRGGVDIFFVISGFVMVQSTMATDISPREFLLQRCRRIVPLYWIATAAMLVQVDGEWLLKICSFLFIPAMNPKIGAMQPVLEPGWTLNYEMFFYVIFAASLMLRRAIRVLAVSAILAALVAIGLLFEGGPMFDFYTGSIILEFMFGMAIARYGLRLPLIAAPLGLIAMIAMQNSEIDRLWSLGLPAAAIVAALLGVEGRIPKWKFADFLGSASYSIYLVHLFALSALVKLWPTLDWGQPAFAVVALAAMTATGCSVYWALEKPLVRLFRPAKRPKGSVAGLQSSLS
jgi:exopolysaccharide production protein ExoZ